MVCGTTHLTWSRITYSILAEDMMPSTCDAALTSWRKVIFTKSHFDASQYQYKKETLDRLKRYHQFICSVVSNYRIFSFTVTILALSTCMGCLAAGGFYAVSLPAPAVPAVMMSLIGIITIAWVVSYVLLYLPGRVDVRSRWVNFSKDVLLTSSSKSEGLVDALSNRKASLDLDMAFAVQYIIERLLRRSLPTPNSSTSKSSIYKQLTANVYNATGSLQPLLVAAIQHLPNELSWAVDWTPVESRSKKLIAQYLESQTMSATGASNPIFQLCDSLLSIRAYLLCKVSSQCAPFQATNDNYIASERRTHWLNLEQMMRTHSLLQEGAKFRQLLTGIFTEAPTVEHLLENPEIIIGKYLDLVRSFGLAHMSGRQLLDYLRSSGSVTWPLRLLIWSLKVVCFPISISTHPLWSASERHEILKAHIKICNYMARADQSYFCSSSCQTGRRSAVLFGPSSEMLGLATGDMRADDLVLLAPGVQGSRYP